MPEKVYDCEWNEQRQRLPGKRYAYTTHPETLENCYRQYCDKREAQADKDAAEYAALKKQGRPETLEQRLARLEKLLEEGS